MVIQVNPDLDRKLYGEIRDGLQMALTDAVNVQEILARRRQERLIERYNDLALWERDFFEVVDIPVDWGNIKPVLRWCETDRDRRIWDYVRNIVSSMPENSVIGRQMRYFFFDDNSGRLLGIVCLASALTLIAPRHQRLRWNTKTRFKNLNKILNIAVCVPIQPFGILCGGKLLFVSSLSNEIRWAYKEKYGDDLLAIETTSLYGKSSQYNRVSEFEYLGLTKGDGNIHISPKLWNKIQQYLFLHPEHDTAGKSSVKLRRINDVARAVGLSGTKSTHGQQRGYYWGITATNSEAILTDKTTDSPNFYDRPLADLIDFWYKRWYLMRLPKKQDEIENFDVNQYRLDNNVPREAWHPKQGYLF